MKQVGSASQRGRGTHGQLDAPGSRLRLPSWCLFGVACGLIGTSCSTHPPLESDTAPMEDNSPPPSQAIVCIIHGDGDYNFHDSEGREYKADEQALAGMQKVAELNANSEVFIFHQ